MGPPNEAPGSAGQQVLRDDHALNFARPLADLAELRVAQVALDVELARVAVAAVDLERRVLQARVAASLAKSFAIAASCE